MRENDDRLHISIAILSQLKIIVISCEMINGETDRERENELHVVLFINIDQDHLPLTPYVYIYALRMDILVYLSIVVD